MFIWVALKENVKEAMILWTITETRSNPGSLMEASEKLSCSGKPDANSSSWSYNMGSHAKKWVERCCELANKNNSTIIQSRNSMYWRPPIQGRKSGICWRFVKNMFWNACIWLVMVDLIIYGPWTNLLVLSQNGPELVTNAQHVWSLTFITQMNSDNVVMWKIQHNNAY